jgi:hypothetical protein
MKTAVIQSNYIPWRGYFNFIDSVDTFVIYDDVQYSKGSWRNRNQLKYPDGLKWITVPVKINLGMNINEVTVKDDSWKKSHLSQLQASLSKAPYYKEALEVWEKGVAVNSTYLSEINENIIRVTCQYLDIKTNIIRSEQFGLSGSKTERLMELFKKTNTTSYLSGPAAESYLDLDLFKANQVQLKYKSYHYEPYPQQFDGFEPAVTVFFVIFNKRKK